MTVGLVWVWTPIPTNNRKINDPFVYWLSSIFCLALRAVTFSATFHFGFFGLTEIWDKYRGRPSVELRFCARWLNGIVRQPVSLGFMLVPWVTPHMTVGQLDLTVGTALYVLLSTPVDEVDPVGALGDRFASRPEKFPAFLRFSKSAGKR